MPFAYTLCEMKKLGKKCKDNVKLIKSILTSEDILVFAFETADGAACAAVYTDGMTDKALLGEQVARPLAAERAPANAKQAAKCLQVPECKEENDFTKMAEEVLAGNVALFIDGIGGALILGLKKISLRAIMEPPSSIAIKGPREGFIEDIKTNMSLLRNRLQTPKLRFYNLVAGKQSRTKIAVGYLDGIADEKTVQKIVKKIECQGQVEIAMPKLQEAIDEGVGFDNVFCLNDLASVGVVAALEEDDMLDQVGVYGVDGSPDAKALIQEGMMEATAAQFPSQIGRQAAEVIYQLLNGGKPQKSIQIPVELITPDNVSDYGTERWQ